MGNSVTEKELCERACKTGIKAYQNVTASLLSLSRLPAVASIGDHIASSAMFHTAIIRYAKPFLNSEYNGSNVIYPGRHLKNEPGFDIELHKHILSVRNTLVAHDDFSVIEPRILIFGFSFDSTSCNEPLAIATSNKCISYPANLDDVRQLLNHVNATVRGIKKKLEHDISNLRDIIVNDPQGAAQSARYSQNYGVAAPPDDWERVEPPDFMSDAWLNAAVPIFTSMSNGYLYEESRYRKDFFEERDIAFPDGSVLSIKPK